MPLENLVQKSSLFSLEGLRNNPIVYIFTNADDYIHRQEDIQFMSDFVGQNNFYLYPDGGHVGNLWFPRNRSDLESVMRLK